MITVVTPTIPGREEMLAEAEASVAAQTLKPDSHLILRDDRHDGPAPTLNALISMVDTDWYAVLNDDDLLDPEHLETLMWAVKNSDLGGGDVADIAMSWPHGTSYRGEFDPDRFIGKQDQGMRPGCYLGRRSMWHELGGYRDQPIEDYDFVGRAIFRGYRVAPVYEETWTYRAHDGQSSRVYEAALSGAPVPEETRHLAKWL